MEWLNIESQNELVEITHANTADARSSADAHCAGDLRSRASDHPISGSEEIVRAD
jgi:hypothetical protein